MMKVQATKEILELGDEESPAFHSLLPLLRRIGREYAFRLQSWGMPAQTATTLLKVYLEPEDAEPSLLADDVGDPIPRQTMTFILDSLERRKLVWREGHAQDRRRKIIRITPAGERLAKKIYEDLLAFEQKGLSVIPTQIRPTMRTLITRYIDVLSQENLKLNPKTRSTV